MRARMKKKTPSDFQRKINCFDSFWIYCSVIYTDLLQVNQVELSRAEPAFLSKHILFKVETYLLRRFFCSFVHLFVAVRMLSVLKKILHQKIWSKWEKTRRIKALAKSQLTTKASQFLNSRQQQQRQQSRKWMGSRKGEKEDINKRHTIHLSTHVPHMDELLCPNINSRSTVERGRFSAVVKKNRSDPKCSGGFFCSLSSEKNEMDVDECIQCMDRLNGSGHLCTMHHSFKRYITNVRVDVLQFLLINWDTETSVLWSLCSAYTFHWVQEELEKNEILLWASQKWTKTNNSNSEQTDSPQAMGFSEWWPTTHKHT